MMANVTVSVVNQNNVDVLVTPVASSVISVATPPNNNITIDRGAAGPAGPNSIGGYGFNISNLQPNDVLMFGGTAWFNNPQTEITDGGNF